jgi:lipid-A-disaccharide synthase
MRVMFVAGETSGDLHGSGVVRALHSRVGDADIFGVGGDRMRAEGMECIVHVEELSVMGFAEVLRKLPRLREVERRLTALLDSRRPDVVVLIDYPGFNLRFARAVKSRSIPVLYYISPQVWAWHRSRVRTMRGLVDRMMVVFPFEVDIYEAGGIPVEFVGHPLLERLHTTGDRGTFLLRHGLRADRPLLALIPGSRRQEVQRILPPVAEAAAEIRRTTGAEIAVSVAPHLDPAFVRSFLPPGMSCAVVEDDAYGLMEHATAAIVTSGTATLETGWFGTPMAVVYRTSPLTYIIGRMLVRVGNIGLVNIVAGGRIVPEFIQDDVRPARLAPELQRMITDERYAADIRRRLAVIRSRLGEPGASERVVDGILGLARAA